MQEILSELSKGGDQEELHKKISHLSYKAQGLQSYSVVQANNLVAENLLGNDVPMTGQVPMPGGLRFRSKDGTYGVQYGESEESQILRRWQAKIFEDDEHGRAKKYREDYKGENIARLREALQASFKSLPKFEDINDVANFVDNLLSSLDYKVLVNTQLDSFQFSEEFKHKVNLRMNQNEFKNFEAFAPYSYFHFRLNYIFSVAVASSIVKLNNKSNTHQDLQYLFYLPFCHGFASEDNEQIKLASVALRENQFIITKTELKTDFAKISKNKNEVDLNVDRAWGVCINTTRLKHEESSKGNQLTKDESEKRAREVLGKFYDTYDVENEKMLNKKESAKYESLNLYEKYDALFGKMFESFELVNEEAFSNINKKINEEQVKVFHSHYADIFPPDTDLCEIVDKTNDKLLGLYMGDIDIYDDFKKIISCLTIFDSIYMLDPVQNPWNRKREFNPISEPHTFLADTLKVVHFLIMIYPLVLCDKIRLVPDVFDFHISLREKLFEVCKRKDTTIFDEEYNKDETFKEKAIQEYFESIARLPDDLLRKHFKKSDSGKIEESVSVEDMISLVRSKAKASPTYLDQEMDVKKGSVIIKRSGVNLEASILMGSFLSACPASFIAYRRREYKEHAATVEIIDDINVHLSREKVLLLHGVANPFDVLDFFNLGPFVKLRALFGETREIIQGGYINKDWANSFKARYTNSLNEISEMLDQIGDSMKELVTGLEFRETTIQVRFIQDINSIESIRELAQLPSWQRYNRKNCLVFFDLS